jgi:Reverse transcriptase (RNA-dependent DNA polymerase)
MKLPIGVKSCAFADDVCFYKTGRSTKALAEDIQRVGEMFNEWCHSRLLTLSAEKSELVLFSRKHHPDPVQITINGHQVHGQEKVKYLGLLFHRKLSWREHINRSATKQNSA